MSAHFGLDFSSSSLKVAEARSLNGENFELLAFGEVKNNYSLQSNNVQEEQLLVESVKKLIWDAKIHTKEVYISLQESYVYTRVIEIPTLNASELKNAIKFESEQYIPIPLEEVYLEYQILNSPPKGVTEGKMEVLLVAARKRIVDKIMRILQAAGLVPVVMETELFASMRSLSSQLGTHSMIVDIGDNSTDIVIIQEGTTKQTSTIPTGGEALTRAISQKLGLSLQQAKRYKHTYGLDETQLEGKVALALKEPIDEILAQIVKNIRFVRNLGGKSRVDQVILSGGTALLPHLTTFLVEQLNTEVIMANPLQRCTNKNLPQALLSSSPRFSSVIGLAIRE